MVKNLYIEQQNTMHAKSASRCVSFANYLIIKVLPPPPQLFDCQVVTRLSTDLHRFTQKQNKSFGVSEFKSSKPEPFKLLNFSTVLCLCAENFTAFYRKDAKGLHKVRKVSQLKRLMSLNFLNSLIFYFIQKITIQFH